MPELFASLPQEPIDRLTAPLRRFLHVQAASGLVLLIASVTALLLANSQFSTAYLAFWELSAEVALGEHAFRETIKHLINDALMAVFFFVVGLEVKRELVHGELRDLRKAILPLAGAIGGMVMPALVYVALQYGQPGMRGWGIPMATDIAFVVGCLAVLGSRVPHSLRIMLLTLAIADDIGAIMVIAIGYTEHLSWPWLSVGAIGIVTVSLLARLGVRSFGVYTLIGIVVWFAFHESGIHATIAGVILGLMTPGRPYFSRGVAGKILDRAREVVSGEGWETLQHRADRARALERLARESVSAAVVLRVAVEDLLVPAAARHADGSRCARRA
jgi:Na+:H+ antiporter, NhaA family